MSNSTKFGGPFLPFPRWVLHLLNGDNVAKSVLLEMLCYMDANTQRVTTSYQTIAKNVGCDRRTAMRAVNRLVELGVVVKRHRDINYRQITNEFVINFNNPNALGVSPETPPGVSGETLPSVTGDTPGGDTTDTPGGDTGDTQSRITNTKKKNNQTKGSDYEDVKVDRRLKR